MRVQASRRDVSVAPSVTAALPRRSTDTGVRSARHVLRAPHLRVLPATPRASEVSGAGFVQIFSHTSVLINLSRTMSDSILDRVKEDLTQAMKDQDEVRRRALRSLRAALANKEIEQRALGALLPDRKSVV